MIKDEGYPLYKVYCAYCVGHYGEEGWVRKISRCLW